jgi:hypothetical protein
MSDADFRVTAHEDAEGIKAGLAKLSRERAEDRSVIDAVKKLVVRANLQGVVSTVALIVVIVLAAQLNTAVKQAQETNTVIKDCTVSTGKCAQRNAASTALLVTSIAYTTDSKRLASEIAVAQSNGNDAAVKIRQDQLADDNNIMRMILENFDDIAHDRPQRNQIPLPTDQR